MSPGHEDPRREEPDARSHGRGIGESQRGEREVQAGAQGRRGGGRAHRPGRRGALRVLLPHPEEAAGVQG